MSRNCEKVLSSEAAAAPAPSTTQQSDQIADRRLVIPGRRLGTVDAGCAEEWRRWGPVEEVEEISTVDSIPQLDGCGPGEGVEEISSEEESIPTKPQLDQKGADSWSEIEEEERNHEDETDLRDENFEEEKIIEEKVKESVDLFCIHEVKIKTSDFRPDCRKCRKNYYKVLHSICPHYVRREICYKCENVNGWLYKT